jgi:hypothetical protein
MADDFDLEDVTGDSNAGAYRKHESRTGPPLGYVSEKMESALGDLHNAIRWLERPGSEQDAREAAVMSAKAAFRHVLVAFCALHNVLGVANDPHLMDRLLGLSADDFQDWLGAMRSEGSVTG